MATTFPDVNSYFDSVNLRLDALESKVFASSVALPPPVALQSKSVVPQWLVPVATLPVVTMDVANSISAKVIRYTPPSNAPNGFIVECPAGDYSDAGIGGGGILVDMSITDNWPGGPKNQGYHVHYRCSNGNAIFSAFGGQKNITGNPLVGISTDHIWAHGIDGISSHCASFAFFDYVGLSNFELAHSGNSGNAFLGSYDNNPIYDFQNGVIYHTGGDGSHHGIYCHCGRFRAENVHVYSLGYGGVGAGAHQMKVYATGDVQIYNCLFEQAGGTDTTGGPWNSCFIPLDIGPFAQVSIVNNTIKRNSDVAREFVMLIHNRADVGHLPDFTSRPWKHLFAYNTIHNLATINNDYKVGNEGTNPANSTGTYTPANGWGTALYADWSINDCVLYFYKNTFDGNAFGADAYLLGEIDQNPAHGGMFQNLSDPLPAWASARLS